MALIQSRCPECKERIPVDDTRSTVFCMYCGASIDMRDVRVDGAPTLEGVFEEDAITVSAPMGRGAPIPFYVDGELVVTVPRGAISRLEIEPGVHTMWAKVGIEGFTKTEFDVRPGDRFQIEHRGFKGYSVVKL